MAVWRDLTLVLASGVLLASAGMAAAQDRTLRDVDGPAEVPPASYAADQYVDSDGCVFIRAGVGGATRWVPRVNRDRTVVCGRTPSIGAAVAAAPVEATEPVIRRQPAPATPREIAEPAPRRVAPRVEAPRHVARAPARPRVAAPRPVPPTLAVSATVPGATLPVPVGCRATDPSARFLQDTPGCAAALRTRGVAVAAPQVRTAPAAPRGDIAGGPAVVAVTPPADAVRVNPNAPSPRRIEAAAALRAREMRTTASTRGAPGTVLVPAARTTFGVGAPPPGYRVAWEDGRLNPYRGPRTLEGDYQSQAIWTNHTPRRQKRVIYVAR